MSNPINIPALLHGTKPAVQIENGQVITTSIEIARVFDKQHKDVLKAIQNLLADLPDSGARNFAPTTIDVDITGATNASGAVRKSPAYHLTRDGFTLLAMGFTGKKALAFKLAYIDAFNRMEAGLTGRALPPAPPLPPPAPTKTLTFTVPIGETGQRWLLHTDRHGREQVTPLTHDTHIGTPAKLVSILMTAPADLHISLEQQLALINTFLHNLHQTAAGHAHRLGLTPDRSGGRT